MPKTKSKPKLIPKSNLKLLKLLKDNKLASLLIAGMVMSLLVGFGLSNQRYSEAAVPAGFVYRSGKDLMLDGKPYRFVGHNYFGLAGCADGRPDAPATVDRYFSLLRPQSATRTWGFKAQGMAGIDQLITSAEKHNQKVIIALADGAQYCNDTGYDFNFYNGGYKGAYFDWVRQVVSRHKDSPAVMAWEVMNEPGQNGAGSITPTIMRKFFDDSAALIKSIDANHLVFTGSLAPYRPGFSDWAYVHGGPNIDGGSLHEYDYASVGAKGASGHWPSVRDPLHGINKVAYVGEVGVGPGSGCLSDADIGTAYQQKLSAYMNAGAAGVFSWGFDDNKVCNIYSGRQITFGTPAETVFKNFVIPGMTTPAPAPDPSPGTAGAYNDDVMIYSNGWLRSTAPTKYQGDDHYSSTTGSTASYTFSGTGIRIYGAKASHHGIAGVKIDNGSETMVDTYSSSRDDQAMIYSSPALSSGNHTITLRVTGNKNGSSSGMVVAVDKLEVLSESTAPIAGNGDANNDGRVNAIDLSIVISRDGQNFPAADFNNDGTVGAADMAILLGKWTW